MGERTSHAPGTFSWADLTTTDQEAAKTFYAALFGWDLEDTPVGDGMTYTMASIGGKNVAAISSQPPMQRDAGVPSMWNSYITVASADEAAAKAGELGANVHAPPFDVFTFGRMAVIADPQGAFFEVWEPRDSIGAQLVNAPGALCWNELQTPDADGAREFYGALFGWTYEAMEGAPSSYTIIKNGDRSNGGIGAPAQPGIPANWGPAFAVQDVAASLEKAVAAGGTQLVGDTDMGIGHYGVAQDPTGAVFALYAGELDD